MIEVPSPVPLEVTRVRAVVLDWAGTTVDFGSRAPIAAILAACAQAGVAVTEEEARRPMGRAKRDHLRELLFDPAVAERWRAARGVSPGEAEVDALYRDFLVLQAECVVAESGLIEGAAQAVAHCRARGLGIGATTGYTRDLLDRVAARARDEGYEPDVSLSADDVHPGRPAPWLCLEAARRLGVYPMAAVVKIDDTVAGVAAGRHAGAWAVGVVESGNEVGLARAALESLPADGRSAVAQRASARLTEAGAHFLISTIAELPAVLDRIDARLAEGDRP